MAVAVAQHALNFGKLPTLRYSGRLGELRSDKALVRAAQAGKSEAASALIERHYPRVYSFVNYLTNGRASAEDLSQEVFTRALGALGTFNGRYQFEPWLLRIARNLVIDESRKNMHRAAPTDPNDLVQMEPVPHDADLVWKSMSQHLASSTVQNALARMPIRQRTVLVLREIEEMSYADIAQIVGTNIRGVEGTLRRARARFRLEASATEGYEAEQAACKRALRLVALDPESPAEEAAAHLSSCARCRQKSVSVKSADSLLAALPPLAMGGLDWHELATQSIASMAPKRFIDQVRHFFQSMQHTSAGSVAPVAHALQVAGSVALAGAISATTVAGYSQIRQPSPVPALFAPPAYVAVFNSEALPAAIPPPSAEAKTKRAPTEAKTASAAQPTLLRPQEPAALVNSVLNLLTANLPPQISLQQLPVSRQLELLAELPEEALSELAKSLNLPIAPSNKPALLEALRQALVEPNATGTAASRATEPVDLVSGGSAQESSSAAAEPEAPKNPA